MSRTNGPLTSAMSRRTLLTAGTATGMALLTTAPARASDDGVTSSLRALEKQYGARLGVYAHNVRTGETVRHRADTLFPAHRDELLTPRVEIAHRRGKRVRFWRDHSLQRHRRRRHD